MNVPKQFHISPRPLANPDAVILAPNARFTILTSRLIRIESSPANQFQDRASQAVWYRQQPVHRIDRDLARIQENPSLLQTYGAEMKDAHLAALTCVISQEGFSSQAERSAVEG